jgi:hypothetical protein
MSSSIASFTYYYGDPTVHTPFPVFAAVPNCGAKPLAYSLELQSGGPAPTAFSLDTSSLMFLITQNIPIPYNANYNLKLIVKETYDNITTNSACLWTVSIACTRSISVSTNPIPASTIYILDPNNLNTSVLTMPGAQLHLPTL